MFVLRFFAVMAVFCSAFPALLNYPENEDSVEASYEMDAPDVYTGSVIVRITLNTPSARYALYNTLMSANHLFVQHGVLHVKHTEAQYLMIPFKSDQDLSDVKSILMHNGQKQLFVYSHSRKDHFAMDLLWNLFALGRIGNVAMLNNDAE